MLFPQTAIAVKVKCLHQLKGPIWPEMPQTTLMMDDTPRCQPNCQYIYIYIQLALNVCVSCRFRFHHFTPRMPQKHTKNLSTPVANRLQELLPQPKPQLHLMRRWSNKLDMQRQIVEWRTSSSQSRKSFLDDRPSTFKPWNPSGFLKIWNGGNAPVPDVALIFSKITSKKTIYTKKCKEKQAPNNGFANSMDFIHQSISQDALQD